MSKEDAWALVRSDYAAITDKLGRWPELLDVVYGPRAQKSTSSMAREIDPLLETFFQKASDSAHGSWRSIEKFHLSRCANPLHPAHYVTPSGPRRSAGIIPGIAALLQCVDLLLAIYAHAGISDGARGVGAGRLFLENDIDGCARQRNRLAVLSFGRPSISGRIPPAAAGRLGRPAHHPGAANAVLAFFGFVLSGLAAAGARAEVFYVARTGRPEAFLSGPFAAWHVPNTKLAVEFDGLAGKPVPDVADSRTVTSFGINEKDTCPRSMCFHKLRAASKTP